MLLNNYRVLNFMSDFVARSQSFLILSVSLYYCVVYSAIQPLKAASVLNKISSVQFSSNSTAVPYPRGGDAAITGIRVLFDL